jgi:hypothetical protein
MGEIQVSCRRKKLSRAHSVFNNVIQDIIVSAYSSVM